MAKRKVLEEEEAGGAYFGSPSPKLEFISSGCAVLDCALGGGYVLGRVANVKGNFSSGKTLLAIEAMASFHHRYPTGIMRYNEVESAFDKDYAAALGMPVESVEFVEEPPCFTVEDFYKDFEKMVDRAKKAGVPGLYILDSLDALSDEAEVGRDISDATYGSGKAKKMSEMFRRIIQKIEDSNVCLIVISQIRDNIGVMVGKKTTRSGGKALDFYCSQVLELTKIGNIAKTKNKILRSVGVNVRAKVEKNKVGLPFREADFPIYFGYGIDDFEANLNWLKSVDRLDVLGIQGAGKEADKEIKKFIKDSDVLNDEEYFQLRQEIAGHVQTIWKEIETGFLPKRKKY